MDRWVGVNEHHEIQEWFQEYNPVSRLRFPFGLLHLKDMGYLLKALN